MIFCQALVSITVLLLRLGLAHLPLHAGGNLLLRWLGAVSIAHITQAPLWCSGWCIPSSPLKEIEIGLQFIYFLFRHVLFVFLFRAAASILWICFLINVWFINVILIHAHIPVFAETSPLVSPVLLLILAWLTSLLRWQFKYFTCFSSVFHPLLSIDTHTHIDLCFYLCEDSHWPMHYGTLPWRQTPDPNATL